MLLPGTVVRLYDRLVDPKKHKRHVCICPNRRLTLRINSNPYWQPHHRLHHAANRAFLDHDSYVELQQLIRFPPNAFSAASQQVLGRMTAKEARELAWSARRATTLAEEYQALIWDRLVTTWRDE